MPAALTEPEAAGDLPPGDGGLYLTSHIDIDPGHGGALVLRGAGRELRMRDGIPEVIAASGIEASIGVDRVLSSLVTSPASADMSALVGRVVGRGFRAAAHSLAEARSLGAPLRLLLDDLPMAALISGYAALYSGKIEIDRKHLHAGVLRADICSGWRTDGTMLTTLRTEGHLPLPVGPAASAFEATDQPGLWHEMGPLAAGSMRRRRLIGVSPSSPLEVFAMFRDTHVDQGSSETVLHEYSFTARLDPDTKLLSECVARPRVLPWRECPWAAASAGRLDGVPIGEVGAFVSREMRGTSTCTHLNDLLRCLSMIDVMLPDLS
ncbi:MAG: DUF2889 domain-containing protein [Acidimicrobiales bacterium]